MNVPQLRFSGFEGEWETKNLNEFLEFKNGINADKDSYGYGTKFINVLDILNNDFIDSNKIIGSVNASEQQLKTYSVTYGDILFLRSSETREDVGKCNVYLDQEKPAVFGGFVIRGKKIAEYEPFFLKTLLNSSSARNQISSKSGGSTRYNVSQNILSDVAIKIPNISEQERIASFVILLDRKIQKQQEKIERLEQFKKGMMQKVFSQELRFKDEDGGEFPEWEEILLKNIFNKYRETVFVKDDNYYEQITISKSGNISYRDTKVGSEIGRKRQFRVNLKKYPNTLTFIRQGVFDGAIGFIPSKLDGSIVTENMPLLELNDLCNKEFFEQYLKTSLYYEQVIFPIKPTGSAQIALHEKDWLEQIVTLPHINEQKRIADFLLNIDRKVDREKEKLVFLEEQKRGFTQRMFV
ncbi:restriction endonuclease subunit S [Planomicrobium sp. YIM 101495]|uniref:restriction endonuclease subunit S n=1 Tax=Planomicrobium sp. YIM 101495 TaxID=2665160 RepID=UPI0012B6F8F5|nr:restriction endonuclease subunit S [Planomicrobium sp. YIM 101495]MTD31881.1 restriction endonuclease subunit S [Planomicrobium sp. YIM 101495]